MTTSAQVRFLPVNTFAEQVAARIRAVAGARGIRPSDVARELEQAQGPISLKWRGLRAWKLEDIEGVARILGTTPSDLCAVPRLETTEAPVRLDEGSDTVRHQGLEPRTRWFGALVPAFDVVGTGTGFDATPARWELAA